MDSFEEILKQYGETLKIHESHKASLGLTKGTLSTLEKTLAEKAESEIEKIRRNATKAKRFLKEGYIISACELIQTIRDKEDTPESNKGLVQQYTPEDLENYITLSDQLVAKYRLSYDERATQAAKALNLNLANTAQEKNGHHYIGKITHEQALKLNLYLGGSVLDERQGLDLILLLLSKKALDGNNQPIPEKEQEQILDEIIGKKDPWRGEHLASSYFENDEGSLCRRINYKLNSNGSLGFDTEPLQKHLRENRYVELTDFNEQGLAIKKSRTQKYQKGKNIYFFYPVDGFVAGFRAVSVRANLYCVRYPAYSYPALGVRFCVPKARAI